MLTQHLGKINTAQEILCDPARRSKYDHERRCQAHYPADYHQANSTWRYESSKQKESENANRRSKRNSDGIARRRREWRAQKAREHEIRRDAEARARKWQDNEDHNRYLEEAREALLKERIASALAREVRRQAKTFLRQPGAQRYAAGLAHAAEEASRAAEQSHRADEVKNEIRIREENAAADRARLSEKQRGTAEAHEQADSPMDYMDAGSWEDLWDANKRRLQEERERYEGRFQGYRE